MILRSLSAFALSIGLAGCGYAPVSTDRVLTVAEVEGHMHFLDGKRVRINGWLGQCSKLDCALYATSRHLLANDTASGFLGIASSRMVDEAAKTMAGQQVIVTAIVNDECRGILGQCTDRAPDLYVTDLQSLAEPTS